MLIGETASHELDTESPDGYDGIDFTRFHIRDRLRSTIATLDSSSDDHGLSVFEALGPMLHDGPLKLQYPYMPASKREAAVRLLLTFRIAGSFYGFRPHTEIQEPRTAAIP